MSLLLNLGFSMFKRADTASTMREGCVVLIQSPYS